MYYVRIFPLSFFDAKSLLRYNIVFKNTNDFRLHLKTPITFKLEINSVVVVLLGRENF